MSRTIKHQVPRTKAKMPKMDKGTKTTMLIKIMREAEEEDYPELSRAM